MANLQKYILFNTFFLLLLTSVVGFDYSRARAGLAPDFSVINQTTADFQELSKDEYQQEKTTSDTTFTEPSVFGRIWYYTRAIVKSVFPSYPAGSASEFYIMAEVLIKATVLIYFFVMTALTITAITKFLTHGD